MVEIYCSFIFCASTEFIARPLNWNRWSVWIKLSSMKHLKQLNESFTNNYDDRSTFCKTVKYWSLSSDEKLFVKYQWKLTIEGANFDDNYIALQFDIYSLILMKL